MREGGYYWNSGIFLFRRDKILQAFARFLPELYEGIKLMQTGSEASLEELYQILPNISLDHGIMEKADNVAVFPTDIGRSDLGTWGALYEFLPKDDRGNVIQDRALDRDSKGCIIYAQNRLVATIGLENVIVVDTPDATLVCHRDRAQELKDLVTELHRQQLVESVHHTTVERL